ncbi:hypothetical protein SR1949_21360 [Sphaerospermopsis reniformis]|uniref:Uncharacterized protein n=1 Tax=Sphaerospermopsis reniformis TaxID=531300 RepID=A0A479ZWG0_9CYAN|nr:hypothetical protein SR1949_21360 [Sphaerospermopsis reniformis]
MLYVDIPNKHLGFNFWIWKIHNLPGICKNTEKYNLIIPTKTQQRQTDFPKNPHPHPLKISQL